MLKPLT